MTGIGNNVQVYSPKTQDLRSFSSIFESKSSQKKSGKKLVKLCLQLSYTVQVSNHFDDFWGTLSKLLFFSYSRIAKLEKLRQKGDFDSDEEDEGSGIGGRQAKPAQSVNPNPHPESAESSVEGIYLSGQVRQSHPFKVIEPEPDRRSVCSETRSSQGGGRSSVPKSIIHEPNSRADSLAKLSSQVKLIILKCSKSSPHLTPIFLGSTHPTRFQHSKSYVNLTHCSKSSFFVQKFNSDFPRKLSIFWGKKIVKMLWFGTF